MATRQLVRKQIRGFILVWTLITLVMGVATFLAIASTYNSLSLADLDPSSNLALPLGNNTTPSTNGEGDAIVVLPSIQPEATFTPLPTQTPVAVAQAAETNTPEVVATEEPTMELTPTVTPTTPPINDTAFQVGIQVQAVPDFNQEFQDGWFNSVSNDLGLNWVKQQLAWEITEPEKGNFQWAMMDMVTQSAREFNIKLMLSIVAAPEWAREPGVDLSRHGPPANNQDFVDFVTAVLNRYPGQIHGIEVWNEMNLDREWTSVNGLSASNYVALLRDSYNAIKAIDPNIIVISGALSPTGLNDGVGAFDDFVYMDQLIEAGMLDVSDCVGAHHNGTNIGPSVRYNEVPNDPTAIFRGPFDNPHHSWSFRSTLEGYANRVFSAGSTTPLCVTEFGWAVTEDLSGPSPGFEFASDNTLDEQATWIPEAMSNMEEWGFVWLAFIWNFNYGPQGGYDPNNDNVPYSLIGPDFTFRPAYDAIREWQRDYLERTQ